MKPSSLFVVGGVDDGVSMAIALPNSGALDHRVTILRATISVSAYNEDVESFSAYITVWARRVDAFATETYRAAEKGARIDAHFTVRYSPETTTITARDRLLLENGLEYDITGVREFVRNQWIEIDVVARTDKK